MTDDEALSFLRRARDNRVVFALGMPVGGHIDLEPDEVVAYLNDPDAYLAAYFEVPVGTFVRWLAFVGTHGRCTGTTKGGRSCSAYIPQSKDHWFDGPKGFRPGITDRCHSHEEQ